MYYGFIRKSPRKCRQCRRNPHRSTRNCTRHVVPPRRSSGSISFTATPMLFNLGALSRRFTVIVEEVFDRMELLKLFGTPVTACAE